MISKQGENGKREEGNGKSASGATTKAEVSDARLTAAFDAATLRWLAGLNRFYLTSFYYL